MKDAIKCTMGLMWQKCLVSPPWAECDKDILLSTKVPNVQSWNLLQSYHAALGVAFIGPISKIFFSLDSLWNSLPAFFNQIWRTFYRFRDIRAQRGQKRIFGKFLKSLFFIRFEWFFFAQCRSCLGLSVVCQRIWAIFYRFQDIRDQRGPKMHISTISKIFISYPIWTIFFAKCRSHWGLSVVCQRIWALLLFSRYKGQKGA